MRKGRFSARYVARMGLLFALAIACSYLENLLPAFFGLMPGVKPGLSNIVTMFCLFTQGAPSALLLAVLKGSFALLTRGPTAGLLSAAGGVCSVAAMRALRRTKASDGMKSVVGAVTHNLAQLAAETALLGSAAALRYAPVLLASGVLMGALTAAALRALAPALARLPGKDEKNS